MLGDRYELGDPIGRGGMATIYRARDTRMGRMVAVKILREMYSSDPKFVLRFQREARAVSALSHPNIVQVYDYGRSGDEYFIVMELIEGTDLRRYLKTHGILDIRRATVIAHDVALALGAAHQRGIVHRDVKPQNILVNDQALVKLTDFGIATFYRDMDNERLTTTGMTLGTVQYYAPEQAQGEVVTPAADVYALGVVLYEMLVGHPPFDGDTPVAIAVRHIQEPPARPGRFNPNIPPALERIILRCLEKDPRDRYRDGDALAYALETYDKPRSSSGRMDTPGAATRARSGPMNATGRANGPRGGDFDDVGDFGVPFNAGPTRANVPAGTLPRQDANGFDLAPEDEKATPVAGAATAIIVASLLLLLAVGCFVAFRVGIIGGGGTSTGGSPTITVPNFVNEQFTKAQADAAAISSDLILKATYAVNAAPAGQILDQNPAAGIPVHLPYTVNVDVSSGPNAVAVPDVTNMPYTTACAAIQAAGLICNTAFSYIPSTLPQGDVVRTDPPAKTQVGKGTLITLYLSEGAPTATPTTVVMITPTTSVTVTPTGSVTPTNTPTTTPPTATPTDSPTPSPTP